MRRRAFRDELLARPVMPFHVQLFPGMCADVQEDFALSMWLRKIRYSLGGEGALKPLAMSEDDA